MTLPDEEAMAIGMAREFLFELLNPRLTPHVPGKVRERARRILKHFPYGGSLLDRYGKDGQRAAEFGNQIRRRFGKPVAETRGEGEKRGA